MTRWLELAEAARLGEAQLALAEARRSPTTLLVLPGDPPGRAIADLVRRTARGPGVVMIGVLPGSLSPGKFETALRPQITDIERDVRVTEAHDAPSLIDAVRRAGWWHPGDALTVLVPPDQAGLVSPDALSSHLQVDPTTIMVRPTQVPSDDAGALERALRSDNRASLQRLLDPHAFSDPSGLEMIRRAVLGEGGRKRLPLTGDPKIDKKREYGRLKMLQYRHPDAGIEMPQGLTGPTRPQNAQRYLPDAQGVVRAKITYGKTNNTPRYTFGVPREFQEAAGITDRYRVSVDETRGVILVTAGDQTDRRRTGRGFTVYISAQIRGLLDIRPGMIMEMRMAGTTIECRPVPGDETDMKRSPETPGYYGEGLRLEFLADLSPDRKQALDMLADIVSDNSELLARRGIDLDDLEYLGAGSNGAAWRLRDGRVLKVTTDDAEAHVASHIRGKRIPHIFQIHDVWAFPGLFNGHHVYGLVTEAGLEKPSEEDRDDFDWMVELLEKVYEGADQDLYNGNLRKVLEGLMASRLEPQYKRRCLQLVKHFNLNGMLADVHKLGYGADLHSGNFMMRPDGTYVIIDIGTGGSQDSAKPPFLDQPSENIIVPPLSGEGLLEFGTGYPGSGMNGPPTARGSNSSAWSGGMLALREPERHVPEDENEDERDISMDWGAGRPFGSSY